jgi:hypothetical protein
MSRDCPNKLQFKSSGRVCFKCTLPQKIGDSTFHSRAVGEECGSLADDKIVPMCWHAYHHWQEELFKWARFTPPSSGSEGGRSSKFAAWLSEHHAPSGKGSGEISNAARTFVWYYKKRRGSEMGSDMDVD